MSIPGFPTTGLDTTGYMTSIMNCMTTSGIMNVNLECATAFTSLGTTTTDPITGVPVYLNSYLDSYCGSSCFSKMQTAYSKYGNCVAQSLGTTFGALDPSMADAMTSAMSGAFDSAFAYMCTKNFATGNYCMADSVEAATYLTAATAGATSWQTSYCDYIQKMGCCFSTLLNTPMYTAYGTDPMSGINQLCGFTASPPGCATVDKPLNYVQSTFTLSGFDYSTYQSLTDEFKLKIDAALAADLATAIQQAKERISVSVTGSGADLAITVSVVTDDGTQSFTLNSEMVTKLQAMAGLDSWTNLLSAVTATGNTAPQALTTSDFATKTGVDQVAVATDIPVADAAQQLVSLWTAAALAAIGVAV